MLAAVSESRKVRSTGPTINRNRSSSRELLRQVFPKPLPYLTNGSGADRDRTGDPLLAKQVLSQLSYRPKTFTA
jgi:hypothetical protein